MMIHSPRPHQTSLLLILTAAGGTIPRADIPRRNILIDTCVAHGWLAACRDAADTIAITKLGRLAAEQQNPAGYAAALNDAASSAVDACVPAAATTVSEAEQIIREAASSAGIRTFAISNRGGRA